MPRSVVDRLLDELRKVDATDAVMLTVMRFMVAQEKRDRIAAQKQAYRDKCRTKAGQRPDKRRTKAGQAKRENAGQDVSRVGARDNPSSIEEGVIEGTNVTPLRTPVPIDPAATLCAVDVAFARKQGMTTETIMFQWQKFISHHQSKQTKFVDWAAAWRTWCLNWVSFGKVQAGTGRPVVRDHLS